MIITRFFLACSKERACGEQVDYKQSSIEKHIFHWLSLLLLFILTSACTSIIRSGCIQRDIIGSILKAEEIMHIEKTTRLYNVFNKNLTYKYNKIN